MKGDGRAKGKKRKVSVVVSSGVDGGAVSSFERELGRWNVGQVPAPPPPLATSHHHQTHKTLHTLQATYYQHTTQNITHITSYALPTHNTKHYTHYKLHTTNTQHKTLHTLHATHYLHTTHVQHFGSASLHTLIKTSQNVYTTLHIMYFNKIKIVQTQTL